MKRCLLVFFLVVVCAGCAAPQINLNGYPAVENFYTLRNPATGIEANFYLTRYFLKMDEGEEVLWPEHLAMNKKLSLGSDTVGLCIHLMIRNPNNVKYQLWESYKIYIDGGPSPINISRQLAWAKLRGRYFKSDCPLLWARVKYNLEIRDENGDLLFVIGEANYKIKK